MKSVIIFIVVCFCVGLLAHTFMHFLGAPVEKFGVVWWVITVVSGIIGNIASKEFGND